MRLTDVCEIQMGYTARGRLEPSEFNGVPAIQLRDISTDGRIDLTALTCFSIDDVSERYLAHAGDVLFRSRGERNTATIIDTQWNGSAVVVSPLMLLRTKSDLIAPHYLAWILNQPSAQRHFDKTARGTSLRMIPRSSLNDLVIDVPPLSCQVEIVDIDALADREGVLSGLLAEKRRMLGSLVLNDHAKKSSPNPGSERHSK